MAWKELKQQANYFYELPENDLSSELYKDHLIVLENDFLWTNLHCWDISLSLYFLCLKFNRQQLLVNY